MRRAVAFQAHNDLDTGILPPQGGVEMEGMVGWDAMGWDGSRHNVPPAPARSPAPALPRHRPPASVGLLLIASLGTLLYLEGVAEEAL